MIKAFGLFKKVIANFIALHILFSLSSHHITISSPFQPSFASQGIQPTWEDPMNKNGSELVAIKGFNLEILGMCIYMRMFYYFFFFAVPFYFGL